MIDVVSDADVVLKWFHAAGEQEVEPARALLRWHRDRRLRLQVLDLTRYELANALVRGKAHVEPERVSTVLDSLAEICSVVYPTQDEMHLAIRLAAEHGLSVYDASYAAVAQRRRARLVTMDAKLLRPGLGQTPRALMAELEGVATPSREIG